MEQELGSFLRHWQQVAIFKLQKAVFCSAARRKAVSQPCLTPSLTALGCGSAGEGERGTAGRFQSMGLGGAARDVRSGNMRSIRASGRGRTGSSLNSGVGKRGTGSSRAAHVSWVRVQMWNSGSLRAWTSSFLCRTPTMPPSSQPAALGNLFHLLWATALQQGWLGFFSIRFIPGRC